MKKIDKPLGSSNPVAEVSTPPLKLEVKEEVVVVEVREEVAVNSDAADSVEPAKKKSAKA